MSENKSKKMSQRRHNRITAMQALYMLDINTTDDLPLSLNRFFENREEGRDYYAFAEELIHGFYEEHEAINTVIQKYTTNWDIHRIAKVDLAILRLASYELLFRQDIPPVVSINEAIDLSKEFSAEDSRKFINGVLDKIRSELKRPARKPAL